MLSRGTASKAAGARMGGAARAVRGLGLLGLAGLAAGVLGCGGEDWHGTGHAPQGLLVAVVLWPGAQSGGVSARGIPAETDLVRVTVTAPDMRQPMVGQCSKDDVANGQARIELHLPSGDQRGVLVEAMDTDVQPWQILASRTAGVTIGAGQTTELHVAMSVGPVLSVRPTRLDFGSGETALVLHVRNAGDGTLSWTISADQPWIGVTPSGGTDDTDVHVSIIPAVLPGGVHLGAAAVHAGGLGEVRVVVTPYRGLANSPWPKFRGNAQNTGLSPYVGPQSAHLRWVATMRGWVESSPAIGPDGTVYVGTHDCNLYAISPDGSRRWLFPTGHSVLSSPAVAADGTVYVGSDDYRLYAIGANGDEKWAFPTRGLVQSSPAISPTGTIYVGSGDGRLYAISPDGAAQWSFRTGGGIGSSPAVGADGVVYVGSGDRRLYAIKPDGSRKWAFRAGDEVQSSPAIGPDGTIYVTSHDGKLYAINPGGRKNWSSETEWLAVESSPAIGPGGTIYVASTDGRLYAMAPDGREKWALEIARWLLGSPVVGADGTIYVWSMDDRFYAIAPDGTQKWVFDATEWSDPLGLPRPATSAAIAADGTIYVSGYGHLFAIGP